MAAFNWIEFAAACPVCRNQTTIRAQTHLVSSFRGAHGDRFCQKTYRIGDTMSWWDRGTDGYEDWRHGGQAIEGTSQAARECCYATCAACSDALYVVVEVVERVVRDVIDIGPESEWPAAYPR